MECQGNCHCGNVCGRADEHTLHECQKCNYERQCEFPAPSAEDSFADDRICEACDGTGMVGGRVCKDCGGRVYR